MMTNKPKYHSVSFSGGKDSTAMLLRMVELGMPIDEIIFCDTGLEFPEMYEHVAKVEKYIGRPITRLKHKIPFEYYLLEHEHLGRKGEHKGERIKGYGFPGRFSRWCTKNFKQEEIRKHFKELDKIYDVAHYVGIAADEQKRIKSENYPLVEWGWTEADCLKYCYDKGFDWGGLYKIFNRVSCWCCPLQSLDELRKLWKHFPHLWKQLQEWQDKNWGHFTHGKRLDYFDERFKFEEERLKQGLPIGRSKEFHRVLKAHLDELQKKTVKPFMMTAHKLDSYSDLVFDYFSKYKDFDLKVFMDYAREKGFC